MSYRKVLEKQGFTDMTSTSNFPGADDGGPLAARNAVADDGGNDSGVVTSFVSFDLDLNDVLARAVQVGPLLDSDCQPCADSHSSESSGTSGEANANLDTNGLAIADQGLCLQEVPVLSLPVLSGLLGSREYTGDHDDATGSATADAHCGCDSATGDASAEGPASARADISVNANLDIGAGLDLGGEGADGNALSFLLNDTSLLGDAAQSGALLGSIVLDGCSSVESGAGASVDADLLPTLDGVLDGLVASTDLLHLFDCGDCSA